MEDPRDGVGNEWQSQLQNWKLKRKDNEDREEGSTKRNGNPGAATGSLILLFYTAKISARPCIPLSSLSSFVIFQYVRTERYDLFFIVVPTKYLLV